MHILVVSQYFWPENFRINDLATDLIQRGYKVTVLTGSPNYPAGKFFDGYGFFNKQEVYNGIKVLRVPLIPRGNGSGLRLAINYLSFAFFSCALAPFLCRDKIDLIFVCQLSPVTVGFPALLLKKIKRAPILFWILDLWPESLAATGAVHSVRIINILDRMVQFIYQGCDKIVVSSKGFISSVESKGISHDRLDYFPNWCEPEYSAVHPKLNTLPCGFLIMFAGNIGVAQDFETILDAADKLRDYSEIHWIILGDGRRSEWVREQVRLRELSASFHLLGRYPPEAMPGFFSQSDVMLVSLKRDPILALTVPGKIQSYMICGRPIIAALDGEGGNLVVEAGAGLSVPAADSTALSTAVLAMYRMSKEDREQIGMRGKMYCEKTFNRKMLLDRLQGWIKDLSK